MNSFTQSAGLHFSPGQINPKTQMYYVLMYNHLPARYCSSIRGFQALALETKVSLSKLYKNIQEYIYELNLLIFIVTNSNSVIQASD